MPSLLFESQYEPEPPIEHTLQFEGGDIKIALELDPKTDLLLNSDLLLDASAFFNGSKADWTKNAKVVQRPATEEELQEEPGEVVRDMNIVTYYLSRSLEHVYMLETKPPASRNAIDSGAVYDAVSFFYLSGLAHGFLPRSKDDNFVESFGSGGALARARFEHRVLFGLLFNRYHETVLSELDYTGMGDLVALAEFYDMIELVAPSIRENLLKREDLWQDVRNEYQFHLALSIKLRCESIFYDALRHLIGSGDDLAMLVDNLDFDPVDAFKIAMKREQLRKAEDKLCKDLQELTLATYMPHARKKECPDRYRTTHASSKIEAEDRSRIQEHARFIVLETFTHHMSGQTHWSHVREYGDYSVGVYSKSSLRNFCNAVTHACQTDSILDLFAPRAASDIEASESEFEEGKKPYLTVAVEEEVKKVVTQMANAALRYIAPPDFRPVTVCTSADRRGHDSATDKDAGHNRYFSHASAVSARRGRGRGDGGMRGRGHVRGGRAHPQPWYGNERRSSEHRPKEFKRVGMPANDDSDCHYFTCIDFGDEEFHPWEDDFEDYKLEGLEPVSEEWEEKVGLGVDDLA